MILLKDGIKKSKSLFSKKFSFDIDLKPIKSKQDPPRKVVHDIPPHNGFGSEEDSLLTVFYLNPQMAVKKVIDNFKRDKHILRFNSKLVSQNEIESERKFVFSFFVADNTMQIFEEASKNSGRHSSKFMERRRVLNPISKSYYTEKELFVGATIYINKYIFKLYECDEKTKSYMIDNSEIFRDSDIYKIIKRIQKEKAKFGSFNNYLVVLISRIDPEGKGQVSREEIVTGLST